MDGGTERNASSSRKAGHRKSVVTAPLMTAHEVAELIAQTSHVRTFKLEVQLKPQEKPLKNLNHDTRELLRHEYAVKYLESINADATPANIAMVKKKIPIKESNIRAYYRSGGSSSDYLQLDPTFGEAPKYTAPPQHFQIAQGQRDRVPETLKPLDEAAEHVGKDEKWLLMHGTDAGDGILCQTTKKCMEKFIPPVGLLSEKDRDAAMLEPREIISISVQDVTLLMKEIRAAWPTLYLPHKRAAKPPEIWQKEIAVMVSKPVATVALALIPLCYWKIYAPMFYENFAARASMKASFSAAEAIASLQQHLRRERTGISAIYPVILAALRVAVQAAFLTYFPLFSAVEEGQEKLLLCDTLMLQLCDPHGFMGSAYLQQDGFGGGVLPHTRLHQPHSNLAANPFGDFGDESKRGGVNRKMRQKYFATSHMVQAVFDKPSAAGTRTLRIKGSDPTQSSENPMGILPTKLKSRLYVAALRPLEEEHYQAVGGGGGNRPQDLLEMRGNGAETAALSRMSLVSSVAPVEVRQKMQEEVLVLLKEIREEAKKAGVGVKGPAAEVVGDYLEKTSSSPAAVEAAPPAMAGRLRAGTMMPPGGGGQVPLGLPPIAARHRSTTMAVATPPEQAPKKAELRLGDIRRVSPFVEELVVENFLHSPSGKGGAAARRPSEKVGSRGGHRNKQPKSSSNFIIKPRLCMLGQFAVFSGIRDCLCRNPPPDYMHKIVVACQEDDA
jgi:hypothetical protein